MIMTATLQVVNAAGLAYFLSLSQIFYTQTVTTSTTHLAQHLEAGMALDKFLQRVAVQIKSVFTEVNDHLTFDIYTNLESHRTGR